MITLWLSLHALADDARSHLDQARYFVKQEWYDDALEQLVKAVGREEGDADPEAWFLLAQVRYHLCDLPGAREAANTAVDRASDPDHRRQTREFATFLSERFGLVQLTSNRASAKPITLELDSTLYDPDLKLYVSRLSARLGSAPLALPAILGLPVGEYRMNGALVQVDAGKTTLFDPNRPHGQGQRAWLELAGGGQLWATLAIEARPMFEASLAFPLDERLTLGPVFFYHPHVAEQEWASLSGGLRLGVGVGDVLRFTPSLLTRYGTEGFASGLELAVAHHNRVGSGTLGIVGRIGAEIAVTEEGMSPGTRVTLGMAINL